MLSNATRSFPDKPAVVHAGDSLTFGRLDERTRQVASALRGQGAGTGTIVPILLPRGVDAVAALFGIWRAGAAGCIIDTEYPRDRIDAMLADCGGGPVIDAAWLDAAYAAATNPATFADASPGREDLALVVFTSGSTGKPKGVMLPYHVVHSLVDELSGYFREDDVYLCATPLSFVAVLATVVAPVAAGLTLHLADDATRKDVSRLAGYARENGVTVSLISPAMAPAFLDIADGQLRTLFSGSERVRDLYSEKTRCYCVYGASETGSLVSYFPVDKPYANTPIGFAARGSRFHLLDENDRPVEPGGKGEICISGQIALGYLNRPELTAERFIPNPFSEGQYDKILFRTGDIGRLLPDGAMEYVERKDWMIKVRGYRVEPGEIETVMLASGPVTKAVVVGYSDRTGEQKLYGCYTSPETFSPAVLRERLREKLPDYMMPAFLEQVASLPVNANGKIDRTRIAPPDLAQYQAEYAAPSNAMEKALCEAFQEALGLPLVGVDDDFVRLGGDSASAVAVQLRLPEAMRISVASLTGLRTPRAIAAGASAGGMETVPLASDRDEWSVSYEEQWHLNVNAENPLTSGLAVDSAFSLEGPLDAERLEASLRCLVERNRVLRSVYRRDAGGAYRRTIGVVPDTLLRRVRCPEERTAAEMERLNRPFDPAAGPLYRFTLFENGPDRHVLWSSMFHAIIDGPGMQIFWDELAALYSGTDREDASPRPDFLDFAEWRESGETSRSDREFYDGMYADGLRTNRLPTAAPLAGPMPCDGAVRRVFPMQRLEATARKLGVAQFSLLVAALGLVLGKRSGRRDVTLALLLNLRYAYAAMEKKLGLFADHFPIRLRWGATGSLAEYAKTVDSLMTAVQERQGCCGHRWLKESLRDADYDATPIIQVNYRRAMVPPAFQGLRASPFAVPRFGGVPGLLDMLGIMQQAAGELNVMFLFPSHYFARETVESMGNDFARVLEAMDADGTVDML